MNYFRKKWYQWFQRKLTVACDISPFYHAYNEREQLFHHNGMIAARRFAKNWVAKYKSGQARIIYGHVKWEEENETKNRFRNEQ